MVGLCLATEDFVEIGEGGQVAFGSLITWLQAWIQYGISTNMFC